jgi:hypothetical protein
MKRHKILSARVLIFLTLLAPVYLTFAGCTGSMKTVPEENRLLFTASNANQGVFSSGDLVVNYSYLVNGAQLALTGTVNFRRSFDSLDIFALLIDANGLVTQKKLVYASGFRTSSDRVNDLSFQESLVLQQGTVGLSFDYFVQDRRSYK